MVGMLHNDLPIPYLYYHNLYFMKRYLLTLVLLGFTFQGFSQTKADYKHAIARFMKYYNNQEADSMANLFSDTWGSEKNSLWPKKRIEEQTIRYGKMKSYRFVESYRPANGDGGGDGLALFKTTFNRSKHMTALSLDKQNKIMTFRFKTSSPHIDSLLSKSE